MPTQRFAEIPADAFAIIETCTGHVLKAETVSTGLNSEIAARIHTMAGSVFVKGLRAEHPRVWTQAREAAINPHVRPLAPALLWHTQQAGWDLLGFEDIDGPHADYMPGSPHLRLVVDAMRTLASLPLPDLPLKTMPDRMRSYVDNPADADLFAGDALLHTDWNPHNVLIADRARLVDWAWAAQGAEWIDPALWGIWLIAAGHTSEQAEHHAAEHPAWATAPSRALDAFARAQNRLWDEIAGDAPDAWTAAMQTAAATWHRHRRG